MSHHYADIAASEKGKGGNCGSSLPGQDLKNHKYHFYVHSVSQKFSHMDNLTAMEIWKYHLYCELHCT